MIVTTLCFLIKDDKVLLAMKKRGFGAGKFNGVGGKLEPGESVLAAAVREVEEEISVKLSESNLRHHATLFFEFENKPGWNQKCCVFVADSWRGSPGESEEMKPEWFKVDNLPFENMWVDDPHWLPKVLAGLRLRAKFIFDTDGKTIKFQEISEHPLLEI
jgi:8-oxo-dGTP pyrophosphatase MutT (NUDIX family)